MPLTGHYCSQAQNEYKHFAFACRLCATEEVFVCDLLRRSWRSPREFLPFRDVAP